MDWTNENIRKEAVGMETERKEPSVHDTIAEELSNKDHAVIEKDLNDIMSTLSEIRKDLRHHHNVLVKGSGLLSGINSMLIGTVIGALCGVSFFYYYFYWPMEDNFFNVSRSLSEGNLSKDLVLLKNE